jgi:hypothetical protein
MPTATGGWRVPAALQLFLLAMPVCWACLQTVRLTPMTVARPRAPADVCAAQLRGCLLRPVAAPHELSLMGQALQTGTAQ